jgi:hypothetical protein
LNNTPPVVHPSFFLAQENFVERVTALAVDMGAEKRGSGGTISAMRILF